MKKILKITLMSDLCAAVGKNYAALIDTDTAIDEYGLPYIPSKRIKGCLKEIVEFIGLEKNEIDSIFGTRGNNVSGTLLLTDARVENYENYKAEIIANKLPQAKVTDLFCSVRSETAIENDVAKDKSLRFTRVVNRISPVNKKNMNFVADISFQNDDFDLIEKLCKGLRNIGYHRNRGLGAIKCELIDCNENNSKNLNLDFVKSNEQLYRIDYKILLKSDLMIPDNNNINTLDYIPGTNVLGALAGKYKGENFEKIFLSGSVRFENLYPVDSKGNKYVPSPRFLGKVKAATNEEDKGIKNLVTARDNFDGKIYKPLKSGFVNVTSGHKETETKITYHNAMHEKGKDLYTQECMCAGQVFKGVIVAPGEYIKEIADLLEDNVILLGRSKTAQYASCEIIWKKAKNESNPTKTVSKSQTVAFVCESDVVLTDENGLFTTELEEFKNQLGLADICNEELGVETTISTRLITGYNAKWNLKKMSVPAIAAGSCIVFDVPETKEYADYIYIGEKQNEGFGKIKVYNDIAALQIGSQKSKTEPYKEEIDSVLGDMIRDININDEIMKKAIRVVEEKDNKDKSKYRYLNNKKGVNPSQVGRAILMCKESENRADFNNRIESIKTTETKSSFQHCFNDYCFKLEDGTDIKNDWEKSQKLILTILTLKKYQLKGEGKK